jgi:glycosyltransferase involved in cell wall biosynthesis/2-polyprenyl-3-methyl-5-hydroxy-6-metoxy-1,4-benzoquinol methylase
MRRRTLRVTMLLHKSVVHDSRVRREARALAEAGHDVTVLELAPVAEPTLDGFARRSVLPPPWVRRALPFQLYRLVFAGSFATAIRATRPDVIHAHDAAMLLPGLVGRRLTGARLVYDAHELATGVPYRDGRWAAFVAGIERLALPRVAAVVTVSDGIADHLVGRYGLRSRPVVLRNVPEAPEALPPRDERLRRAVGVAAEAPLVLHQGSAAEGRGVEVLLEAVTRLEEVHLALLGPSEAETERLDGIARGLGVAERLHVLPAVPVEELLAWTSGADVGVSLLQDSCENHRLALPNKVFEYLAAGLPVVTSDLPELRRLVSGRGVGWVTRPGDADALREVLAVAVADRGDPALGARVTAARDELRWARERWRLTALYDALADAPRQRLRATYATYGRDPGKERAWARDAPGAVEARTELEERLVPAVLDALAGGGAVLDVGCGTGWLLALLAARGVAPERLHGLDLLSERVAAAGAAVPGAAVIAGDATALPHGDASLAVVTLVTVLSSLERPEQHRVLAECARVLRPGGVLFVYDVRVPNPANPAVRPVRLGRAPAAGLRRTSRRTLTVAPPLRRRLGRAAGPLYPGLQAVPLLRTHRLWTLIREPSPEGGGAWCASAS